eukprot:gene10736-biopygen16811
MGSVRSFFSRQRGGLQWREGVQDRRGFCGPSPCKAGREHPLCSGHIVDVRRNSPRSSRGESFGPEKRGAGGMTKCPYTGESVGQWTLGQGRVGQQYGTVQSGREREGGVGLVLGLSLVWFALHWFGLVCINRRSTARPAGRGRGMRRKVGATLRVGLPAISSRPALRCGEGLCVGETADASGTRPFLQNLQCGTRPGRPLPFLHVSRWGRRRSGARTPPPHTGLR